MTSIEGVRDFEKLPENAQNNIRKVEDLVEVPSKLTFPKYSPHLFDFNV